jgi:hypothetical protein
LQGQWQFLVEGLAVAEAGEGVAVGHFQQPVLVGDLQADVAEDAAARDRPLASNIGETRVSTLMRWPSRRRKGAAKVLSCSPARTRS